MNTGECHQYINKLNSHNTNQTINYKIWIWIISIVIYYRCFTANENTNDFYSQIDKLYTTAKSPNKQKLQAYKLNSRESYNIPITSFDKSLPTP